MNKVTTKLFPAQEASERVLLVIRRHWFTYAIFWLIAIFMSLPLVIALIYLPSQSNIISNNIFSIILVVLSCYSLIVLALLIYGFIDFYLDIYIVTDRRVVDIKQNGFFNRTISELNLHQIQDVKASVKGIFPTILHYGEVAIQTAGERENFNFTDVPHPYRISKIILDLHEQALSNNEDEKKLKNIIRTELPESMKDFDEGYKKNKAQTVKSKKSDNLIKNIDEKKIPKKIIALPQNELKEGETIELSKEDQI